ncbi:putative membrane protein YfcA [Mariprofundus ferrinatatus]|uniref:Probable membrane transporter protein n=1 Tax=Mariprofundus ferrinatatus TaxID=1921087 RepID=A0A2K8L0Y9_9PROT|nr:sulfite exporter TauE/SafE family protein [Mariprofundus ferrinatatus]ATX80947.1 putative membrane protein YfcA [Mariprofundus ferrinatatus]
MSEIELGLIIYGLLVGLGAGLIGGALAGLAGVGGGLIYVPLFYLFAPPDTNGMAMHVFASMVAVVMTGYFSARSHWHLGHVNGKKLVALLPGLVIGAAVGLWNTLQLSQFWILTALALLNAWVAFDYGRDFHLKLRKNMISTKLLAWPIGFISGTVGIGGGTMIVPLLRRTLPLKEAVGTASMAGVFMVLCAVILNFSLEPDWVGVLVEDWQFLVGVWIGIVLIVPFSAHKAAALHGSVDEGKLRLALKTLFIALSLGLLGAALLALFQFGL